VKDLRLDLRFDVKDLIVLDLRLDLKDLRRHLKLDLQNLRLDRQVSSRLKY